MAVYAARDLAQSGAYANASAIKAVLKGEPTMDVSGLDDPYVRADLNDLCAKQFRKPANT